MARLPWHEREQLLLEAIRDLEDDSEGRLENLHLPEPTGLDPRDVSLGLRALQDGEFITGMEAGTYEDTPGGATSSASAWRQPAGLRCVSGPARMLLRRCWKCST